MFTIFCANARCENKVSDLMCTTNGVIPPEGWEMWLNEVNGLMFYFCCRECKEVFRDLGEEWASILAGIQAGLPGA